MLRKNNGKYTESLDLPNEILVNSNLFFPSNTYNQKFSHIVEIDKDDFTAYIGQHFCQEDAPATLLSKLNGIGTKYSSLHQYNSYNWPEDVPVPKTVRPDYENFYYDNYFCIIKPKFNTHFPDFVVKTKSFSDSPFVYSPVMEPRLRSTGSDCKINTDQDIRFW